MFRLIFALVLAYPTISQAGPADAMVEYSRDEHYIYAKLPLPLTLDDDQIEMIKAGIAKAEASVKENFVNNPRVGKADAPIPESSAASVKFSAAMDQTLQQLQKNYGTLVSAGWHSYNAWPTALVIYGGIAFAGTRFFVMGGSGTIGAVVMLKKVFRTHLDTGATDNYIEPAANLVYWGSAFFGKTPMAKTAIPVGAGLVWGNLAKPEDFTGLSFTVSARKSSPLFGAESKFAMLNTPLSHIYWKYTAIKSLNKSAFPSFSMISATYMIGDPEGFTDPIASLSYIGDLSTFVHGGLDMLQSAGQKLLGMPAPPMQIEKLPGTTR